jgi:hypothetical protein
MSGIFLQLLALGSLFDPFWKYVTLLLHGNGTNGAQNNTFLDSSSNAFTITRNGTPTQGSVSPFGPDWSNYFNTTADSLTSPSNTAIQLETSTVFTVEAWVYLNGVGSTQGTIVGTRAGVAVSGWELRVSTSRQVQFYYTGVAASTTNSTTVLSIGTWYHVAFVRNGSTAIIYINGVLDTQNNAITNGKSFEHILKPFFVH